jgi:hypothetical protein
VRRLPQCGVRNTRVPLTEREDLVKRLLSGLRWKTQLNFDWD